MLSSIDWATLRILEYELTILEIKGKKPKVREWIEKRITELREKDEKR